MTTLPTFAETLHEITTTDDVQEISLDWLQAKDIENAAKDAEKVRKAAGKLLQILLGKGGIVTVNRGGFRKYELAVSDVQGRVSADKAMIQMIEDGIVSSEQATRYLEASRGAGYQNISLKSLKA